MSISIPCTEYELGFQGSSSVSNEYSLLQSGIKTESGTVDIEKKDLMATPEVEKEGINCSHDYFTKPDGEDTGAYPANTTEM